jgi:hypothetical protein
MASAEKDEVMGEQPEGTPVQHESAEAAEEAMDKALEEIVAEDVEDPDERPPELAREEPEEKEPEPEEPEDAEARPEHAEASEPEADPKELSDAYQAYLRDGFSKAEVDKLQESLGDEVFVERGLHRLKVQKDTDRLFSTRRRDGDEVEEEPSTEHQAEPAEPDLPASNLRELASPFLEAVEMGDEGKAAAALETLLRKTQETAMQRAEKAEEAAVFALQFLESELRDSAMRELLGDQELMGDSREAVETAYEELSESKRHSNLKGKARIKALVELALKDAAPDVLDAAIRQRKGSASRKPKPTPTRVTRKGKRSPNSDLTPDQRFERAAWGVLDGEDLGQLADEYRNG